MECHLCKENKDLCKSHIIPQFYYKKFRYSKNRFPMISSDPDDKIKIYQSGIWARLLCEECEDYINNNFEQYAQIVISENISAVKILGNQRKFVLSGIDYTSFKLFQLSILWRAGLSEHPLFSEVKLGADQEKLRKMIFCGDPGESHEYGCVPLSYVNVDGMPTEWFIESVDRWRYGHHMLYKFTFGGLFWIFHVSGRSDSIPHKHLFCQPSGTLTILTNKQMATNFLIQTARKAGESGHISEIRRLFPESFD